MTGSATIKKITLTSETKKLSGEATVQMTQVDGAPKIEMATDAILANNIVTLDCTKEPGGGVTLTSSPTPFYIVVPATDSKVSDNAFKVIVESTTGVYIKRAPSINGNRFNKAKIVKMPTFAYSDAVMPEYVVNGISRGKGTFIGTCIWAPVNCGYTPYFNESDKGYPYGKLYQWGRKDGHGYGDKIGSAEPYRLTCKDPCNAPVKPPLCVKEQALVHGLLVKNATSLHTNRHPCRVSSTKRGSFVDDTSAERDR